MATTTAFSSLIVPPDDTMEMSSPANRDVDDDIDIDFDDYQGGVQIADDDQMLEDVDATRPTTATDDVMEDDALAGEQVDYGEEVMQDDGQGEQIQQQEDEELIDYGEDELPEEAADVLLESNVFDNIVDAETGLEEVDEEITRELGTAVIEQAEQLVHEAVSPAEQTVAPELSVEDQGYIEDALDDIDETFQEEQKQHIDVTDQAPTLVPAPINTALGAQTDTPGTPTDTGLHPMSIRYGDVQMPLFRSKRQLDGLLKDDNLASLSLAELIKNCRQRLAIKIGEDVSEDQELVLGFEGMGLILVEDSRSAFESSLNDVLEVYLQLHQNDGTAEIPPLSLDVTLQLKFASSFSLLKQAAAGGQGMTSFGFLHPETAADFGEDGYEDLDQTGYDEQGQFPSEFEERLEEAAAYDDQAAEQDQDAEDPGLDADVHDTGAEDYEGHENELEYEHELNETEEHVADLDRAAATEPKGKSPTEQQITGAKDQQEDAPRETEQDHGPAYLADATQKADSTASSTTVQGDGVSGNTGEYEDDLIDWDDDSLTSDVSEPATVGGHDDFSTFLTEYEYGEHDLQDQEHVESTHGVPNNVAKEQGNVNEAYHDAANLGPEDFLNELGDTQFQDETYNVESYQAGHEGDDAEYNQDTYGTALEGEYDYTDNFEEQQGDGYHPDYQPTGEDDDLYHTAQDFLAGQGYEHGLEYDSNGGEDYADDTAARYDEEEKYPQDFNQEFHGDELEFDDQDEPPQDNDIPKQGGTGSPLGKRSFDEIDELDDDEPEAKKAKPS